MMLLFYKSYMLIRSELSALHYRDVNLTTLSTLRLSGAKLLRGKQKESWTDGPLKGWAWKVNVPPPIESSSIACYWNSLKATYATL